MPNSQRGFAPIVIIVLAAIILTAGGFVIKNLTTDNSLPENNPVTINASSSATLSPTPSSTTKATAKKSPSPSPTSTTKASSSPSSSSSSNNSSNNNSSTTSPTPSPSASPSPKIYNSSSTSTTGVNITLACKGPMDYYGTQLGDHLNLILSGALNHSRYDDGTYVTISNGGSEVGVLYSANYSGSGDTRADLHNVITGIRSTGSMQLTSGTQYTLNFYTGPQGGNNMPSASQLTKIASASISVNCNF